MHSIPTLRPYLRASSLMHTEWTCALSGHVRHDRRRRSALEKFIQRTKLFLTEAKARQVYGEAKNDDLLVYHLEIDSATFEYAIRPFPRLLLPRRRSNPTSCELVLSGSVVCQLQKLTFPSIHKYCVKVLIKFLQRVERA